MLYNSIYQQLTK